VDNHGCLLVGQKLSAQTRRLPAPQPQPLRPPSPKSRRPWPWAARSGLRWGMPRMAPDVEMAVDPGDPYDDNPWGWPYDPCPQPLW